MRNTLCSFVDKEFFFEDGLRDSGVADSKSKQTYGQQAYFSRDGFTYAREETHVGNSIIAYERDGATCYGTIQGIEVLKSMEVVFTVLPYLALPENHPDQFSRYAPHFPTQLLSSKRGTEELVTLSFIKCHCARYPVSNSAVLMILLHKVCGCVYIFLS